MLGNHKHETLETQANERHDNNFRLFWSVLQSARAAYTNETIFIVFVVFKQRTTF